VNGRAAVLVLLLLTGCAGPEQEMDVAVTEAATLDLPERFGFGTPADEGRIAAWDIDVRPDGVGLREGSGTVDEGAAVYLTRCAACHGLTGVEGPNNRLVGTDPWEDFPTNPTVGNYWPYATTLFDYIGRAMPLDSPGSLTPDEKYAVIAWILNQNGIIPADAVMNAETLPAVQMPARDRFVVDDRLDSDVVR
jgi:mono/diheme cytochrome c family protein